MAALIWDRVIDRRYEAGVSHGVFYPSSGPGVVWNGLISVEESIVGGEQTSYYVDGVKYLDFIAGKDYQANVSAFNSPKEFESCIGKKALTQGLILAKQPKDRFHFSYQTHSDEEFKLHLVYNVLAAIGSQSYLTENRVPNPTVFTWTFTATPVAPLGFKPSAHYVIDSTKVDPATLSSLMDILYGTNLTDPEFPTIETLVGMFTP